MTTATTETKVDEYEALGITSETWACVAVMSKADANRYVVALAASGVPALLAKDPDGKRWHVAVQGGFKASPTAWLVSIRGEAERVVTCQSMESQHPQALRK